MDHSWITSEVFWPSALGVVPIALAAAAICRWSWTGPTTRHTVWVTVLASFLVPMALLPIGLPSMLHSLRTDVSDDEASLAEDTTDVEAVDRAGGALESGSVETIQSPTHPIEATTDAPRPSPDPIGARSPTQPNVTRATANNPSPAQPRERAVVESPATEPRTARSGSPTTTDRTHRTADAASVRSAESGREASSSSGRSLDVSGTQALREAASTSTGSSLSTPPSRAASLKEPSVANPAPIPPAPASRRESAETHVASTAPDATPLASPALAEIDATTHESAIVAPSRSWSQRFATLRPRFDAWLDGVRDVQRAITSLPPLPTTIWLGGALLIGLVTVTRFAWIHRVLRDSLPGSARVRDLVAEEGARLGLARMPVVRMVSARVSPMVWCGRSCVLLLPEDLWAALDEPGRRAVVVHELAHLKRRDHWVRWVELVVSVLYWWHPVVWWVRHRVREESDLCCDAWVTTLMPTGRRSYAQALLCTQTFLVRPGQGRPALGHGALTSAGRRFARRVTMVMKGRPSPRTSIWGTALSLGLLLAAAAATPILACPPDEKEKVKAAEQALKVELQRQQALEKSQVERTKALEKAEKERATALEKAATQRQAALEKAAAERHAAIEKAQVERHKALELAEAMRRNELAKATAEKAAVDAEAATTFEQFMRNRGQGGDDTTELLRRLLDRIERLEKRLDSFERQGGRSALPGSGRLTTTQPLMPAPSVEGSVTAVQAPSASTPQPTLTSSRSAPTTAMSSGGAVGGSAPSLMAATSTDRISRQYTLPKGKLELLNQLMIREDVPVLVSPSSNSITVHGTAEQHKTFKAFIDMIHPTADLSAPASAPGVPAAQPPAPGAQPAAPRGGSASGRVSTTTADAAHTANLHTAMSSLAKQADQLDVHSTALQAVIDQLKARASKAGEAEKQDIHREMERLVAELVRLHTQAADVRAQAYMARVASEAARQQAVEETTPR